MEGAAGGGVAAGAAVLVVPALLVSDGAAGVVGDWAMSAAASSGRLGSVGMVGLGIKVQEAFTDVTHAGCRRPGLAGGNTGLVSLTESKAIDRNKRCLRSYRFGGRCRVFAKAPLSLKMWSSLAYQTRKNKSPPTPTRGPRDLNDNVIRWYS